MASIRGKNIVAKKTYTCPCGKTVEYKGSSCLGDFMKATGWDSVICNDGSVIYMCSECFKKAVRLGEKVVKLVGNKYCVAPSLRGRMDEKD